MGIKHIKESLNSHRIPDVYEWCLFIEVELEKITLGEKIMIPTKKGEEELHFSIIEIDPVYFEIE